MHADKRIDEPVTSLAGFGLQAEWQLSGFATKDIRSSTCLGRRGQLLLPSQSPLTKCSSGNAI